MYEKEEFWNTTWEIGTSPVLKAKDVWNYVTK
jgi:hypothetical protein